MKKESAIANHRPTASESQIDGLNPTPAVSFLRAAFKSPALSPQAVWPVLQRRKLGQRNRSARSCHPG